MLSLSRQLLLLFYFVLYPVWVTYPTQDPIIRGSAAQRTEGRFVPVLGSTPSAPIFWVATRGINIMKRRVCMYIYECIYIYIYIYSAELHEFSIHNYA